MKTLLSFTLPAALALSASSCIGTDFIDNSQARELRLVALPDTIAFGDTVALSATYFNEVGIEEALPIVWTSADPAVFRITAAGQGIAVATGSTTVSAEVSAGDETVRESFPVNVGKETVVNQTRDHGGTVATTSSYPLSGDFQLTEDGDDLVLSFGADYNADTRLPGLYIYLTNNASTNVGALEIAKVTTFSGAHSYRIEGASLADYSHVLYFCKPFSVKVGDGEIVKL